MSAITAWILGHTPGDFISPALLERIAGVTIRPMDRVIARENLKLFKQAMDDVRAEFYLYFGTLLGAVREKDFIAHDYDTDLIILEETRVRLAEAAPRLIEAGFAFARSKSHGRFVTFLRKGEFIDVYVPRKSLRLPCRRCWDVDGCLMSPGLLAEFTTIPFLGASFGVPRHYEAVLGEMYGADWRIEKKNYAAPTRFDLFHPYRSAVILAKRCLPPSTFRRLKRLLRRA